jgi:hypothetical protein
MLEFAHPAWPHFAHLNWPHLMLIFCLDRPFKSSSLRSGLRIPMMSISQSDLMPIRSERSDARLSQFESVIDIRQHFCSI